ncbi:hypothetical protein OG413_15645 [Streptomyces sp. NBC_01433]|uniref:hypothetical protein n=1 Tax=Streptomyces sp. NBC_01433 TaxID=2903864 RepID=UPI00224F45ED|nr:hypothetical protein [Streptomyces sp. NBC_01433]MCX4676718.1 hypothetical protein [Streptomyces sp. NBC_01433]
MYLAAPGSTSSVFGFLGSGGLALCLTALLVFGIIGKGSVKLTTFKAGLVALATGSAYSAAGKIWANPQQVVEQGWTGLGVGGGPGPFGEVGIGAACLLLLILMLVAPLNPVRAAILCLIASFTWPNAGTGSVWDTPGQLLAALFLIFGA